MSGNIYSINPGSSQYCVLPPSSSSLYSLLPSSSPAFPPTETLSFSLAPSLCLSFALFLSLPSCFLSLFSTFFISSLTTKQVSRELFFPSAQKGHRPVWPLWRPEPYCDWLEVEHCRHSVSKTKTQGILPVVVPEG